jgi:hypothetical protein
VDTWTVLCECDDGSEIYCRNTKNSLELRMPSGQIIAIPDTIIKEMHAHLGEPCKSCGTGKLEWLSVNNLAMLTLSCDACDRNHILADGTMCLLE